jgi:mannose-6-phosphate isomerase-like protein (cupin superfamily)
MFLVCRGGESMLDKVNLRDKLDSFEETWVPKIVGELNGQYVKLVKFDGEYVWHSHAEEDEMFLVLSGQVRIEFRDRHVILNEGEFVIVPHGVEHRPVAPQRAEVLLFEPASTRNTGKVDHGYTIEADDLERI